MIQQLSMTRLKILMSGITKLFLAHAPTHKHTHAHTLTFTQKYTHICMNACMHACMHTHTHVHAWIHTCTYNFFRFFHCQSFALSKFCILQFYLHTIYMCLCHSVCGKERLSFACVIHIHVHRDSIWASLLFA